jgi:hypothetical protein
MPAAELWTHVAHWVGRTIRQRRTARSASILNMADPLALTIAANVATKVADSLTNQAQQAIAAIVRKIREKLRSRPDEPSEAAMLDIVITTSDSPATEAFARVLEQLFAADLQFREEIQALWDSARLNDGVTNVFHGKADKVIMMRDVNGDLTINLLFQLHRQETALPPRHPCLPVADTLNWII